ncbi:MAG: flagellar basal-body rod protein FlgF [Algicola sp.]|nr:flagellar basal-body rod protein FlgF [Algicola sp.]
MDRMLYVAASGAKQNLNAIAVRANNLANAATDGFKADMEQARSMQAFGEGLPTRVFAMTEIASQNFDDGALKSTGRDLDIAIEGKGWIVVQDAEGKEAFTRKGNLKITENGTLETANGLMVMGDGGPITLPVPLEKVEIGRDGTITVKPQGAPANALEDIDRIKLVNPNNPDIHKGKDGLYRRKDGKDEDAAGEVTLVSGMLESSNVNAVGEMTSLISIQRQFEMQIKMMQTAEENDKHHNQIFRVV